MYGDFNKSQFPNGVQVGFKYGVFEDIVWNDIKQNDNWITTI